MRKSIIAFIEIPVIDLNKNKIIINGIMVCGTMTHMVCLVEEIKSVAGTEGNLVKKPGCKSLV